MQATLVHPSQAHQSVEAEPTVQSTRVCRDALALYDRLLQHCCEMEPDLGFSVRHASGRRSLELRVNAQSWSLAREMLDAVNALFDRVERAADDDVDEWVDWFPTAFLTAIERRHTPRGDTNSAGGPAMGLRFEERLVGSRPLPIGLP